MKQLGSIIDWGHPGQPPAAIMSRFLPKLFLRRAETDISTISRAAGREISAICYSGHHVACNFALKSFQTIPKVAACGQTQSLYFAFKGRRHSQSRALHCGSSRAGMEFVWRRSILSESADGTQYTTLQLFGHSPPTKESGGTCGVLFAPATTPQFAL